LLTFILVFMRWPVVWTGMPHLVVLCVQPVLLVLLSASAVSNLGWEQWLKFLVHTCSFFATALMCHGELARDRPPPQYLTEFYLWMSVGGVLGGLFNALVAPLVFQFGVLEYALAMLLAIVLRPNMVGKQTLVPGDSGAHRATDLGRALDLFYPLGVGLFWFLMLGLKPGTAGKFGDLPFGLQVAFVALVLLCLTYFARPARAALTMAAVFIAGSLFASHRGELIFQHRGFYGFLRVYQEYHAEESHHWTLAYRTLYHGGINHGSQAVFYRPKGEDEFLLLSPAARRKLI